MRKILIVVAALAATATYVASAGAADSPFPAPTVVDVFIAGETATTTGVLANQFAPGQTVVFRAYAVRPKTKDLIVPKDVKYFYVAIPGQPSIKLKYDVKAPGATARMPWTGTWQVPASFTPGLVNLKILIRTVDKLYGSFVQFPVTSAMLTISQTPQQVTGPTPPPTAGAPIVTKSDLSLYLDSVNGTRPLGAKPRAVGCTQSNVFKRGEQLVFRSWGIDMTKGNALLTSENTAKVEAVIPGVAAPLALAWGAHGNVGAKVFFWASAWNIATDYPLGDITVKVTYTTIDGKSATYDYLITIIP